MTFSSMTVIRTAFLAFLLACGLIGAATVEAQDASPSASPAVDCVAPELPPGTPSPQPEEGAIPGEATPEGDMAGMDMGTPEGAAETADEAAEELAEASPVAPDEGTPASDDEAAAVIAAAENAAACFTNGTPEQAVALLTPDFLLSTFGASNPYDALENFPVAPVTIQSVGDARVHGDGRLSVDVVYDGLYSPNIITHERWFFVDDGGTLLLDQFVALPYEGADVTISVDMVDYGFELSQTSVPAGQTVTFTLANVGQEPHEFVVVRLPEGVTADQVLAGEVPEDQIAFYGFAFAEPGGNSYLTLTGLEAGTYTVVCFIPTADGTPHIALGMINEFTVE